MIRKTVLGKIVLLVVIQSFVMASNFSLHLKLSKNRVYVTQPVVATLTFQAKNPRRILEKNINDFMQQNFWVKDLNSSGTYLKNGLTCKDYRYLIFPERAGITLINKQSIKIATRQAKTNFIIWNKVLSNSALLDVMPLPIGVALQGDYHMTVDVDKRQVKAGQAINLTIKIYGTGNIDNIKSFHLNLPYATVYKLSPKRVSFYKHSIYGGTFVQKFTIIADKDFTIPSWTLRYFNPITGVIKSITTKQINIKVQTVFKEPWFIKYIFALVGLLLGLFLSKGAKIFKNRDKRMSPLYQRIKASKSDKELYEILLAYTQDAQIESVVKQLETNIYFKGKHRINKKKIAKYLFIKQGRSKLKD